MTVILIHGMFCGASCWLPLAQRLQMYGVDARMIELHPNGIPKLGRGFDAVTNAVRQQLSDVADKRCILVGHSLGALVVEHILPEFPLAIPLLVNPSPAWGRIGPLYPLWVAGRRGMFWKSSITLSQHESQRLLYQGMTENELVPAMQCAEPESGELVRQAFWFYDLFGAATRIVRRPRHNIHIVTGSLDPQSTPAYSAWLARTYRANTKSEVLTGVGHTGILQEQCLQLLTARIVDTCGA